MNYSWNCPAEALKQCLCKKIRATYSKIYEIKTSSLPWLSLLFPLTQLNIPNIFHRGKLSKYPHTKICKSKNPTHSFPHHVSHCSRYASTFMYAMASQISCFATFFFLTELCTLAKLRITINTVDVRQLKVVETFSIAKKLTLLLMKFADILFCGEITK